VPDESRDWETLRSDAIRAVRQVIGDDEAAEAATDAVLSVVDEEAVNRLADEHIRNTNLRSMDFRNGAKMEFQAARELAAYWVGAARALLDGAENYSETTMTFGIPEDRPNRYSFVVQKAGKLTPHEARRKAEAERDELRATLGAAFTEADVKPCRHCKCPLIPCRRGHNLPVCKGWLHAAWLSMPVGAHYCEGRSVNPSGEPGEEVSDA